MRTTEARTEMIRVDSLVLFRAPFDPPTDFPVIDFELITEEALTTMRAIEAAQPQAQRQEVR